MAASAPFANVFVLSDALNRIASDIRVLENVEMAPIHLKYNKTAYC